MARRVKRATLEPRMSLPEGDWSLDELPRCPACGDVLGVYEPIVHVLGTHARRTSRAAEPSVSSSEGQCYHLGCYERLVGES
jgi:hypothetical protein